MTLERIHWNWEVDHNGCHAKIGNWYFILAADIEGIEIEGEFHLAYRILLKPLKITQDFLPIPGKWTLQEAKAFAEGYAWGRALPNPKELEKFESDAGQ